MPTGVYIRTEETKRKMSKAQSGKNNPMYGKHHIEKVKKKISKTLTGHIRSDEIRKKISEEKSYRWMGDDAGYSGMHKWIIKHRGSAKNYKCEDCDRQAHHWLNIDHKYKRDTNDYRPLCGSCHKKYDFKHNLKFNNRIGGNQYKINAR